VTISEGLQTAASSAFSAAGTLLGRAAGTTAGVEDEEAVGRAAGVCTLSDTTAKRRQGAAPRTQHHHAALPSGLQGFVLMKQS
jgi:hypothetical protein